MSNPVITQTAPQWSAAGASVKSLAIQPLNAGDLLVLAYIANGGPATAVSGGGAGTWQCASSYYDTAGSAYAGIWWAVVTNPVGATGVGTPTVTVTVTDAGLGTNSGKIWVREFMAIGANWLMTAASPIAGSSGSGPRGTGTFTLAYPSLTPPAAGNALYAGAAWSYFGNITQGSDTGFFWAHPGADGPEMIAYSPAVNTAVAPTVTSTSNFSYTTIAAMFTAGGGTVTTPVYAGTATPLGGGSGTWVNPADAAGPPSGSFATWTSP